MARDLAKLYSKSFPVDQMMKIDIHIGGKNKRDWAVEGIEHFVKLLKPHARVSIEHFAPNDGLNAKSAEAFFARVPSGVPIVLLDGSGKEATTEQFGRIVDELAGIKGRLAFFIGGHAGFARELIESADNVISFSKMTFGHRLSLIVLLEQLYRSFDSSSGRKYHR